MGVNIVETLERRMQAAARRQREESKLFSVTSIVQVPAFLLQKKERH